MIRKLLNEDIDRVADIWLKTNLKAHYFITNQYWKSNYELVKEMMSQSEVYVWCEKLYYFKDNFCCCGRFPFNDCWNGYGYN